MERGGVWGRGVLDIVMLLCAVRLETFFLGEMVL